MKPEPIEFTDQTSLMYYKLGEQSVDLRFLKWAFALALTAIFALFSYLAKEVDEVQVGQVKIIERLTGVEHRLDAVESRLSDVKQRISENEKQIRSHTH